MSGVLFQPMVAMSDLIQSAIRRGACIKGKCMAVSAGGLMVWLVTHKVNMIFDPPIAMQSCH